MNNQEKVNKILSFMKEISPYHKIYLEEDINEDNLLKRLNLGSDIILTFYINEYTVITMSLYSYLHMHVRFFCKKGCIFQIHLDNLCLATFRSELKSYAENEMIRNIKKYAQRNKNIEGLLLND
jgi:hypothetical protein